ncbi:MAG: TIM barrel protein [Kofleriaceae bacterium]
MNVGICSWSFAGTARGARAATDISEVAAAWGFAAFEGAFAPRGQLAAGQPAAALAGAPMPTLATLELHRFHLTDENPKRRARAVEVVEQMIDCARAWGASSISFSPGPAPAGATPEAVEEAIDRACDALEPVFPRAASAGVVVALENLPAHALCTRRAMHRALRRLPQARVCLDLGNATLDGPVAAWLDELGDRIEKLHLSDARLDPAFELVLPATGEVPWPELRAPLRALARPIFVEAPIPAGADEPEFLGRVREATQRAMAS